jgi:hypothetical protein
MIHQLWDPVLDLFGDDAIGQLVADGGTDAACSTCDQRHPV